ncbi:folliculin-interacting protein middle domain-containing protein [Gaertneriomyces semiglobifer]|nr:folliculin-interacting protein middle domain-containing protein [Gaertneriomyces semiglobifer]KAI9001626.1 folliculin-interacting protein middle domain-containing protein [Gaertneriomyces semiglobifer]
MFTRLFRRQSQSTSNTTQPHKERGNTQHSHSNASNGKGDASSTHITKDAGPNNENKKLDESIRKALRILICQDTGDKKKLVLYDSAFDVDINTQAAPSQGQGRDVPGAANGSHSTGVNIKIPRRHDDHSMSGSMGGSWRGTWVGSWSSFRSIRDSGSTTVREKGMRDQREKDSMRRLSGVSSVGGRGDDGRDWRSGRGFIGGRRKSLKNLDLIGEMMFGAVPLTPKGITTKIHYFRAPHLQILITKVFTLPTDIDEQEEEEMLSHLLAHARTGSLSSSYESDESWSPVGSVEGGDGSWRSGWGRHSGALKKPRRRVSYSVALLIDCSSTPLLRDFVFTHYILLERHLLRLQKKVLLIIMESLRSDHTPSSSSSSIPCSESHARYHDFPRRPPSTSSTSTSSISVSDRDTLSFPWFSTAYALQSDTDLMEVVHRVQDNISILYEAPRMEEPIWLDMECFPQRSGDVAERFVKMFKEMIEELNAVGKSGFLITFITALLMHHTGWTQTLLPSTAFSPTSPTSSPSTSNPYITQINQLYGNTTSPPRTARTLVIGNKTFAQKLLSIATYFVRCTELVEGVQQAVPHGDNEGTVGGDEQAQEVELGGYVEIALPG